MTEDLDGYIARNRDRFVDELIEWCRIPSISAQPDHASDVRRNAEHLAAASRAAGFDRAELIETSGHPAVYAERMRDPELPTVLVYGHHDVQPVDPLEEWTAPPFEPVVVGDELRCRGAADDKGQVWMHLKAVETHLRTRGDLPLNLRLIVEGEEEMSSKHFEEVIDAHRDLLAADICVVSDTAMLGPGRPSVCVGLRGLMAMDVELTGPSQDLHSGEFGGTVLNPIEALTHILSSLRDPRSGRVRVPEFYRDVAELSAEERAQLAAAAEGEEEYRELAGGVPALHGEAGYTTEERRTVRPTLEVNGIFGGYQGPGSKTIIPARAGAKITCRLVPHQRPEHIGQRVEEAIQSAAPPGVRVHVTVLGGSTPVVTPTDHPGVRAAQSAMREVFGAEALLTRAGGSIPPVEMFSRLLGLPSVLVGVGLPDDRIHSPNEKFDLRQFEAGIRVLARLWDELGASLPRRAATAR